MSRKHSRVPKNREKRKAVPAGTNPILMLKLSRRGMLITTVSKAIHFTVLGDRRSRVTGHESQVTAVQYVIAPTTFSTSAMSTITMASHGQPSKKHPSGPLLRHFLHPMQRMGSTWMRPNG